MLSKSCLVASFVCALATPAFAASSTSTPPILVQNPNGIWCGVTNAGKESIEVTIDVVNAAGNVVSGGSPVTIPAGGISGPAAASPAINGFVYCRANGFSSKKVHVTTCVVSLETIASGSGECIAQTSTP